MAETVMAAASMVEGAMVCRETESESDVDTDLMAC